MYRNTLILPESDARLAARLLQGAIDALDVVVMMVLGRGPEVEKIVGWADSICERTRFSPTGNLRRVVWIRDDAPASIRAVLDPLVGVGESPLILALNFHDQVTGTQLPGAPITPLLLERMFLTAQSHP